MKRLAPTQFFDRDIFGDDLASIFKSRPESVNGTAEEQRRLLNTILVRFEHMLRP